MEDLLFDQSFIDKTIKRLEEFKAAYRDRKLDGKFTVFITKGVYEALRAGNEVWNEFGFAYPEGVTLNGIEAEQENMIYSVFLRPVLKECIKAIDVGFLGNMSTNCRPIGDACPRYNDKDLRMALEYKNEKWEGLLSLLEE